MKKSKTIIFFIILLVIVIGLCVLTKHMVNKIPSVYYRTYTKEKGWSKWVKDGKTSGNQKDNILNIQIKFKKSNKDIIYSLYNDKWSESYNVTSKVSNKEIKALKISLMDNFYKKYDIYYRTYNNDNKWLEWTSNYQISGNKDKNISAVEIKMIEKYAVKNELLDDYDKSSYGSNIGF